MPKTAKGLYAPRVVDLAVGLMGLGSAALLAFGPMQPNPDIMASSIHPLAGPLLLASVVICGIAACLFHRIDRRGWDDYMAQIVSQSALIGMVTFLLSAALAEIGAMNFMSGINPLPMMRGAIPMATLAWAIGYFFLRWRGTGE